MVVGVLDSQSIALSQLANVHPGEAEARSRVTRIREWLKNPNVDVWLLYQALLRHVLSDEHWHGRLVSVMVDGTLVFGDRLQIFRLSLAHGNRAIPLAWVVVPGPGLVQAERLHAMFVQVAEFLKPYHVRVLLLADRGFRDHDWALLCREVGWGYRIRIVRNIHIRLRTGATVRLAVAIATLWCHKAGQFILLSGEALRRLIDPAQGGPLRGHERQLSVFQLGLRWIKRCPAVLLDALSAFQARLVPLDLPPVRLQKT